MVLRAREVQSVGCFQSKEGTRLGGLQVSRLRQCERCQLIEQGQISTPQQQVAALERPNQTFTLDQWRYPEALFAKLSDKTSDSIAPARMSFDQVNEQAGIEIDQSHASRSSRIEASISAAE